MDDNTNKGGNMPQPGMGGDMNGGMGSGQDPQGRPCPLPAQRDIRGASCGHERHPRQVVAGIGKVYSPESLVGRSVVIVANLEPRNLMGVESRGMILAAHDEIGNPVIIGVDRDVHPGSKIS